MSTRSLSVPALLVLATGIAYAGPTYVVTSEWNLYRVSDGGQETFPLADRIHSLHYDAAADHGCAVGHVAGNLATSLAIIPEPAALVLVAFAALIAPRRR